MKILEISLKAFGPFNDVYIDLSKGNEGLHIIYGPNEAGKSSALRALRQMFYGIPVRSTDNFIHPYAKMRIGASIQHSDGEILEFIRRKGDKKTLRATDDKTVMDEAIMHRFLNGIDVDLFTTMFGIDHTDLVNGGKEIIQGGGNIGQVIFAAGSGIANLRKVQNELQDEADELFKPSGKNPLINESINKIKENRKKIRDTQLPGSEWLKHDQTLQEALKNIQNIEQELTVARKEKHRLERIQEALPYITQRMDLMEQLKDYESVVILPENFGEQRRDLLSKLQIAENEYNQAIINSKNIQNDIDKLKISDSLLKNSEQIENIYQELGGYNKASKDRIKLQTQLDVLRSEAKQILLGLRDDLTIEEAESLRINKNETVLIKDLGVKYERIVTLLESSKEEIPKLNHQIKDIENQLKGLSVPRQIDNLINAISQASEYGPLEQQCLQEIMEIQSDLKTLENKMNKQTLWSGAIEGFEQLPIPSQTTIDRFEDIINSADQKILSLKSDISTFENNLLDTEKKIEELKLEQEVPTEEDLRSARETRDQGCQIVLSSMEGNISSEKETKDFIIKFPASRSLSKAFEESIGLADEIADRLRREADRVATHAKLLSDEADLRNKLSISKSELSVSQNSKKTILEEWKDEWASSNISPKSPKEMRAWAIEHHDIITTFADIRNRKSRTDQLKANIDSRHHTLDQCFRAISEPEANINETLNDLIQRGRNIIDKENKLHTKRDGLQTQKAQKESALFESKLKVEKNEKELLEWQKNWEKAVSPLGLDSDSIPSQANAVMDDLKNLFDKLREADTLQKRINGIDNDTSAFTLKANQIITEVAKDLMGLQVDKLVIELNNRLNETRNASSTKLTLENQLIIENSRIKESEKKITDLKTSLEIMCKEASCKGYENLPDAERLSEIKLKKENELKIVEEQLHKLSAGVSIEDFVKEALKVDPDVIDDQINRLSENIDNLTTEKSHLDQTIGSERTELRKMDGSAQAASMAEETQLILGGLEKYIEKYARLRIAACVLNEAIERFREKNQAPILKRANSFFAQITNKAFEGIRAEFDESGKPVIVGIRNGAKEIVGVEGMSDGTADQLYLALRLAGLEEYLDKNEPIPFIIDDILIKFDNARALEALKALEILSMKTQIIFFTHHSHIVDLAEKNIDPTILIKHELREM